MLIYFNKFVYMYTHFVYDKLCILHEKKFIYRNIM